MNATVNPIEVKDILRNKGQIFAGKYLVLLPEEHMSLLEWDGQDHHTRKLLLQGADADLPRIPKRESWH